MKSSRSFARLVGAVAAFCLLLCDRAEETGQTSVTAATKSKVWNLAINLRASKSFKFPDHLVTNESELKFKPILRESHESPTEPFAVSSEESSKVNFDCQGSVVESM